VVLLKTLVLGGTRFVGRHLVEALRREHEVTLFNRGLTNPGLWPDLERIRGDRSADLAALAGRRWDVVVDCCGYLPHVVEKSAKALSTTTDLYVFISSISVFPDLSLPGLHEESPVATLREDERVEGVTDANYGALKAYCEAIVARELPGRALVVRPGLVVGPHDHTGRFTYWPVRVASGGEVLAPGAAERLVQFIDARDLAEWVVAAAQERRAGVFNATGPDAPLPFGELLAGCKSVSESDGYFTWVPDEWLLANGVEPWVELPLWLPGEQMTVDCSRARAAGLRHRPIADTIRTTLEWHRSRDDRATGRAGLERRREQALLQSYRAERARM
jgi:2'-hydroxyisoflavone reductase